MIVKTFRWLSAIRGKPASKDFFYERGDMVTCPRFLFVSDECEPGDLNAGLGTRAFERRNGFVVADNQPLFPPNQSGNLGG